MPVRLGRRPPLPVRHQCGTTSTRSPNQPKGQRPRSATTTARQSGCRIRRRRGNPAKTLRCQFGKKYDVKKVRNNELFFVEEERHVRADNTFSFKSLRFEAPRHLPERAIQVRFQRKDPATRVIVYYKGQRMGQARLLDPVANDRPARRPRPDPGDAAGAVAAPPKAPPPAPTSGPGSAHASGSSPITPQSELSTPHSL